MLSYRMLWIKLIIKYCVSCCFTYILQNEDHFLYCVTTSNLVAVLFLAFRRNFLSPPSVFCSIVKTKQHVVLNHQQVSSRLCLTLGLRHGVYEIFGHLKCYATWIGSQLPTFRDNTSVPSTPQTSVTNHQSTFRNIPEDRRFLVADYLTSRYRRG